MENLVSTNGKETVPEEIQLIRYLVHDAFIGPKRRETGGVWGMGKGIKQTNEGKPSEDTAQVCYVVVTPAGHYCKTDASKASRQKLRPQKLAWDTESSKY